MKHATHTRHQWVGLSVLAIVFALWAVSLPTGAVEEIKLLADDGAAGDRFGSDVAIDGDWAVVSAPGDDNGNGKDAGAAYIFKRDTHGRWFQQAKLLTEGGTRLGSLVAISGNKVILRAANKSELYVFERKLGSQWRQAAKLATEDGDDLGWVVAFSGNRILISARNGAYVFERSRGSPWRQAAKLLTDDNDNAIAFPTVSMQGNRVVMEAQKRRGNGEIRLGFRVFERDADGEWGRRTTVMDIRAFPRSPSAVHHEVSISGKTVLVQGSIDSSGRISRYERFVFVYEPNDSGVWSRWLTLGDSHNFQSLRTGHRKTHYNATIKGNSIALRTTHSRHKILYDGFDIRGHLRSQSANIRLWMRTSQDRWRQVSEITAKLDAQDFNGEVTMAENQTMVSRMSKDDSFVYAMIPKANGQWRRQRLRERDFEFEDEGFSYDSLAISPRVAMMGSDDDTLGKDAGAVHVFDLQPDVDSIIRISLDPVRISEDAGSATLQITRTPLSMKNVDKLKSASVDCVSANHSAKAGVDYREVWPTLQWTAGDIEPKTCTIPLINDGRPEIMERFLVKLDTLRGQGAAYGAPTKTVVQIVDDDTPWVRFKKSTFKANEDTEDPGVEIERLGRVDQALSVDCRTTQRGSARPGSDYKRTKTTLYWKVGETAPKNCPLELINDKRTENDETLGIKLANPVGGHLGRRLATLTILDDEPPSVQFRASTRRVTEDQGTAYLRVELTGRTHRLTKVVCSDRRFVHTIRWKAGDTRDKFCKVPIIDDQLKEPTKHRTIWLSSKFAGGNSEAVIGEKSKLRLSIIDND